MPELLEDIAPQYMATRLRLFIHEDEEEVRKHRLAAKHARARHNLALQRRGRDLAQWDQVERRHDAAAEFFAERARELRRVLVLLHAKRRG